MQLPSPASQATLRDAARLSIQSATAAAAMFLLMRSLDLPEAFVGVLSAVLIVQPSLGSTLGSGMQRVLATIVGCVVGVTTLWLIPIGYGTAAALAISMLVMNAIAGLRPEWRYGVVAAVALSLGSEQDVATAAWERALSIAIGAGVGIAVSLVVWPERASTRAKRKLRRALKLLCEAIERAASNEVPSDGDSKWQPTYRDVLGDINTLIANVRLADNDDLAKQRDAIEDLARAVIVFARCVRLDSVSDAEGNTVTMARESVRALSTDLARAVVDAADSGGDDALDAAIRAVHQRFTAELADWRERCGCQKPNAEDALSLALEGLDDAVGTLGEAFADDGHEKQTDGRDDGTAPQGSESAGDESYLDRAPGA